MATSPPGLVVRAAVATDLPRLQEIERAAGAAFRDLGMSLVADDDPFTLAELQAWVDAGRAWVAVLPDHEHADGYLVLDLVDGAAHIEQVSVHPDAARRGVGARLVEHAAEWAAGHGFTALTLTTFREVPWNGPYYERLGFRYLEAADEGPGLRTVRDHERAHGLDAWPRASMRRDL